MMVASASRKVGHERGLDKALGPEGGAPPGANHPGNWLEMLLCAGKGSQLCAIVALWLTNHCPFVRIEINGAVGTRAYGYFESPVLLHFAIFFALVRRR